MKPLVIWYLACAFVVVMVISIGVFVTMRLEQKSPCSEGHKFKDGETVTVCAPDGEGLWCMTETKGTKGVELHAENKTYDACKGAKKCYQCYYNPATGGLSDERT